MTTRTKATKTKRTTARPAADVGDLLPPDVTGELDPAAVAGLADAVHQLIDRHYPGAHSPGGFLVRDAARDGTRAGRFDERIGRFRLEKPTGPGERMIDPLAAMLAAGRRLLPADAPHHLTVSVVADRPDGLPRRLVALTVRPAD